MKKLSGIIGLSLVIFAGLLAMFAPWISAYSPLKDFPGAENLPPMSTFEEEFFLFGTDSLGRDMWSRLTWGARYTLGMSLGAVILALLVGLPFGVIAGYYPRWDRFLSKASDIMMAFPSLLIAIIVVAILSPGYFNAIVAVAMTSIIPFFKLTRTQVRSESTKEYVLAAKALGMRNLRIIWKHIFPNTLSPLIVLASLSLGSACLEAAALSFLNLGVSPPTPEWGSMIRSGMETFLSVNPWVSLLSGIGIFVSVLGFNLLGDALRDWTDPKKY